jgi:GMP synthase-like glutamine amidotransferase
MPSCLVVQHALPEPCFAVGDALGAAGVEVDACRIYESGRLPDRLAGDFNGLVVMGGPMSAAGDEGFPTRRREIALLAEALEVGLPVLGICLGAQLLAASAGGRVVRGAAGPEIGWAPVHFTAAAWDDPLFSTSPTTLTVLHWHGDTYELPTGAVHLASSDRYPQQAFRVGAAAWGLQFHLEVDEVAVVGYIDAFGEDALRGGTTQAAIANATPAALAALVPHRDAVLARFAALVAAT